MKIRTILAAMAVVMAAGCAKEQEGAEGIVVDAPKIIAEMAEPLTRTCIDADDAANGGTLAMLWKTTDAVGVFTASNSNVRYVNEAVEEVPNASFAATASVNGDITAVYYPYDAVNDGKSTISLTGTIPAEQAMGDAITGDYKYGTLKAVTAEGGYKFKFNNIFSLVRFKIDATGTALEGKTLESVTMTVTRDGATVPVTGDFKFSAVDGTYTEGTTSNELKTVWNQTLDGAVSSFATVFPEVQSGDKLAFTFKAEELTATLTVTSKADFAPAMYYTFPLTLANFSGLKVEKTVSGTFKAATYNVDGLPQKISFITVNGDGPGSSGTANISKSIAADNWDFIGFSEDFEYHSELTGELSSIYTFGTHRGSVNASALYSTLDTDGLCFATRKSTCAFSGEMWTEFSSASGGLSSGANTCIKKGFRHYVVTLADGTEIDVIITHMNTYSSSGSGHINAQHAQLKQVAQYINSIRSNNRPVIFMGDTNCRYTRHDFQTYFWGVLDSDLEVNDPWVDFMWDGVYPTYPSNSLVVEDATGTSDTDIICSSQKGEVVDKIIYINNPNAAVQISANDYLRDSAYQGLADHWPIVVEFSYSGTITMK